jgi:CMP-N-acetylneuraminic acid synthetase
VDIVALIPARAGSKRIPGKNFKVLGHQTLLEWTLSAARESGVFSHVIVSSDDYGQMGFLSLAYGCRWILRPWELAADDSPDIDWVRHALARIDRPRAFAILRPTSPFRTADTIRRAFAKFRQAADCADSLRAIQPVREHPGKMWTWEGGGYPMKPLQPNVHDDGTPWHSSPTQTLPQVYIQNASLEMSWTSNVEIHGTISGRKVIPFLTEGWEGFDINTPEDWARAEAHVNAHRLAVMNKHYWDLNAK